VGKGERNQVETASGGSSSARHHRIPRMGGQTFKTKLAGGAMIRFGGKEEVNIMGLRGT